MSEALPILWSFRRCPYAMRARLAVQVSGVRVALREVVLRDKPDAFLEVSPDGTVPLLIDGTEIVAESFDIMEWALARNDPEGWLEMPAEGREIIARFDGPFKRALDRTKYHTRYPEGDAEAERAAAMAILAEIEDRLDPFLFGDKARLADMAVLPFVRQFAMIDKTRFDGEAGPKVRGWLEGFLASELFLSVMPKLPKWAPGVLQEMPFPRC